MSASQKCISTQQDENQQLSNSKKNITDFPTTLQRPVFIQRILRFAFHPILDINVLAARYSEDDLSRSIQNASEVQRDRALACLSPLFRLPQMAHVCQDWNNTIFELGTIAFEYFWPPNGLETVCRNLFPSEKNVSFEEASKQQQQQSGTSSSPPRASLCRSSSLNLSAAVLGGGGRGRGGGGSGIFLQPTNSKHSNGNSFLSDVYKVICLIIANCCVDEHTFEETRRLRRVLANFAGLSKMEKLQNASSNENPINKYLPNEFRVSSSDGKHEIVVAKNEVFIFQTQQCSSSGLEVQWARDFHRSVVPFLKIYGKGHTHFSQSSAGIFSCAVSNLFSGTRRIVLSSSQEKTMVSEVNHQHLMMGKKKKKEKNNKVQKNVEKNSKSSDTNTDNDDDDDDNNNEQQIEEEEKPLLQNIDVKALAISRDPLTETPNYFFAGCWYPHCFRVYKFNKNVNNNNNKNNSNYQEVFKGDYYGIFPDENLSDEEIHFREKAGATTRTNAIYFMSLSPCQRFIATTILTEVHIWYFDPANGVEIPIPIHRLRGSDYEQKKEQGKNNVFSSLHHNDWISSCQFFVHHHDADGEHNYSLRLLTVTNDHTLSLWEIVSAGNYHPLINSNNNTNKKIKREQQKGITCRLVCEPYQILDPNLKTKMSWNVVMDLTSNLVKETTTTTTTTTRKNGKLFAVIGSSQGRIFFFDVVNWKCLPLSASCDQQNTYDFYKGVAFLKKKQLFFVENNNNNDDDGKKNFVVSSSASSSSSPIMYLFALKGGNLELWALNLFSLAVTKVSDLLTLGVSATNIAISDDALALAVVKRNPGSSVDVYSILPSPDFVSPSFSSSATTVSNTTGVKKLLDFEKDLRSRVFKLVFNASSEKKDFLNDDDNNKNVIIVEKKISNFNGDQAAVETARKELNFNPNSRIPTFCAPRAILKVERSEDGKYCLLEDFAGEVYKIYI